jgi:hypothetical protein
MPVNKERLSLGTAALRSGEYPQASGCLRQDSGYCCLGVLTEVAIANGLSLKSFRTVGDNGHWVYGSFGETGALTSEVREWYGFADSNPKLRHNGTETTAIGANDELRKDFAWIADAFDDTYGAQEATDAGA